MSVHPRQKHSQSELFSNKDLKKVYEQPCASN